MPTRSAKNHPAIFRELCELIPPHLVPKLARAHQLDCRKISAWDHTVSLLYAQFTHALGLNDVCDGLKANRAKLASIRGARPPSRNGLSHANRTRDPRMAEALFWEVLAHLEGLQGGFGGRSMAKLPRQFKRTVHAIDSSTIRLCARSMDWAKHRRQKAAAKLHLRLDLQQFLPAFVVVASAKGHDATRAYELCAGMKPGEIAVLDKAYIDYNHFDLLHRRGIFWVCRAKDNMQFHCLKKRLKETKGTILRDDEVVVKDPVKRKDYPRRLRRVTALVEIGGKLREMTFITNNLEWAPSSICALYQSRWNIEVFFKQLKQTLQLGCFLGTNQSAIEWQIWMALLMYVLLRFVHVGGLWKHSFIRLFTCLRAVLWQQRRLTDYLRSYGTATDPPRVRWAPEQAYLPGLNIIG